MCAVRWATAETSRPEPVAVRDESEPSLARDIPEPVAWLRFEISNSRIASLSIL